MKYVPDYDILTMVGYSTCAIVYIVDTLASRVHLHFNLRRLDSGMRWQEVGPAGSIMQLVVSTGPDRHTAQSEAQHTLISCHSSRAEDPDHCGPAKPEPTTLTRKRGGANTLHERVQYATTITPPDTPMARPAAATTFSERVELLNWHGGAVASPLSPLPALAIDCSIGRQDGRGVRFPGDTA